MQTTLEAVAKLVGGQLCGDGALPIFGASPIWNAGPGQITFARDEQYVRLLADCRASAALIPADAICERMPVVRVADPLRAFVTVMEHFYGQQTPRPAAGIDPRAVISDSAQLGDHVHVGPFVCIGRDVTIGDRCCLMAGVVVGESCRIGHDVVLHPRVVLYPGTIVGNRVTVHAGSVLGADGFGYQQREGGHEKVPQVGYVEIGDDVEIGANTTIDRGTFEVTRIGQGTKIDNQVQIAHNCQIGRHNIIVAQVGIAGSVKTGDWVVLAGQAGIKDHVTIGERAVVGAMGGVMRDVPAGERVVGVPATPEWHQRRLQVVLQSLPQFRKQVLQFMQQAGAAGAEPEQKRRPA